MKSIVTFTGIEEDEEENIHAVDVQVSSSCIAMLEWVNQTENNLETGEEDDCSFGTITIVTGDVSSQYLILDPVVFQYLKKAHQDSLEA